MPNAIILMWVSAMKKKVSAISQLGGRKNNISSTENMRLIEADKTTVMNSWKCGVLHS